MDYDALKAEILLPAYDGIDDYTIADMLNAETIPAVKDIKTADAREILFLTGEWGALSILARSNPSDALPVQLVAAAITAQDTLRLTEIMRLSEPAYFNAMSAMTGAFVAAGVLSQESADALMALRNTMVSRSSQLKIGFVYGYDVETARLV